MAASTASIYPLANGTYHILVQEPDGGRAYLTASRGNEVTNVGLSTDPNLATAWTLQYDQARASYIILRSGVKTKEVLDATRTLNSGVVTHEFHGGVWQWWAIRLHSVAQGTAARVKGYTITPLSAPQSVLTATGRDSVPRPAQIRVAPRNGGNILPLQLWIFIPAHPDNPFAMGDAQFSTGNDFESVEVEGPWELGGESGVVSSYHDGVQKVIAQAQEELKVVASQQG
ncbi:hypothetical protein EDB83DRAFT_2674307 [Lactarius deliciosus]|nr:hypothetical protein EDB83DRAFT_2555948 [Lactarius deliciosus]KAH9069609.1 hypothetical protein EDB83DRAFT_2674307 [Lactarius deliciosus]